MEENKKPENPNAFAYGYGTDYYERSDPGMSLRDYFAAKAMQGLLSDSSKIHSSIIIAKRAFRIADEMLKEREL